MKHSPHTKGFSLIEMLVYLGVLTIIFVVVINTLLSFSGSYRALSVQRIVEHSAVGALERMTRDIRNATSIDTANSTFGTSPGVLTIITTQNSVSTTTKFYVQSGTLKVDVNGTYVGPLTLSNVTVTSLIFTNLTSAHSSAVKIDLTLFGRLGTTTKSLPYHSTVIIKGS